MNDPKMKDLTLKWRQDLLNLKENVKQKVFDPDEALTIAQKMKKNYEDNDVKPNSDVQNAHIQICKTVDQAKNVLAGYRQHNINYTTTTFNILISLADNQKTAAYYFNLMLKAGVNPNTYTFNSFIRFSKTVDEGREVIKSMHKYEVKPNTQSYNALLRLATNHNAKMEILKAMEDQNIEINLVTFNTLISQANFYSDALKFFKELKTRNLKPTINTYVTLLKKAQFPQEIREVDKMRKADDIIANPSWDNLYQKKR